MGMHPVIWRADTNTPMLAWKLWNRGATTIENGDVVCIWVKTSGDTTATDDKIWCRAVSTGDTGAGMYSDQGGNAASQDPATKVAGVVYGGSAAQSSSAIVVWGGIVTEHNVTGTVSANDRLVLGTGKGVSITSSGTGTLGDGKCYGISMKVSATATEKDVQTFMIPWRI